MNSRRVLAWAFVISLVYGIQLQRAVWHEHGEQIQQLRAAILERVGQ